MLMDEQFINKTQSQMPIISVPGRFPRNKGISGRLKNVYPKWLTQYGVIVYILALLLVSFMYSAYSLPWYYMLSGMLAVVVFFIFGNHLTELTSIFKIYKEKNFEKRIFGIAFVLRVIWVFIIYAIFMQNYGDAFGFENADALYYHDLGEFVADLLSKGNYHLLDEITKWNGGHDDISDMGYGIYAGFIYLFTGKSIIVVRLLKCVWSSLTAVLLYRLTKREFGEQTARIAAIFCALWPNFWYYCGSHLKESEMVFLCVLFAEQSDQMLRSRQFTAWKVVPMLLIAAAIYTMRSPLAIVALLALVFAVVMSSSRVVSWGKRIIVGVLAIALIGVVAGNTIQEQASSLISQVEAGNHDTANEWRTERKDGNAFAKYATSTVFAPMIFTIPFPTFVRPFDGQEVQQLNNGGNFIKNIISFFTILALVMLLISGKWREHLLSISFLVGYLLVLTMSAFAHSERFHQPAMPFEMMFAAYGLSIAVTKPRYKRLFALWTVLMFIAAIGWNWFKMAGRGLS